MRIRILLISLLILLFLAGGIGTVCAANDTTITGSSSVSFGTGINLGVAVSNSSTGVNALQAVLGALPGATVTIVNVPGYVDFVSANPNAFSWADTTSADGITVFYLYIVPDGSQTTLVIDQSILNLKAWDSDTKPLTLTDHPFTLTVLPTPTLTSTATTISTSIPTSSTSEQAAVVPTNTQTTTHTATPLQTNTQAATPVQTNAYGEQALPTSAPAKEIPTGKTPAPLFGILAGFTVAFCVFRKYTKRP